MERNREERIVMQVSLDAAGVVEGGAPKFSHEDCWEVICEERSHGQDRGRLTNAIDTNQQIISNRHWMMIAIQGKHPSLAS